MGEFWKKYFLENGQRMSQRQIKKVARLKEEILCYSMLIDHLEQEIDRIKKGGEKKFEHFENDF